MSTSNSKIHEETNTRIYDRNIPSQILQPYVDVRPVLTKYSYLPIVDPRKTIRIPMNHAPTFNIHQTFNPGNTKSPWSGFASNINKESELRNQIFALQKCSQSVYVPSSNSDLYNYNFETKQQPPAHDLLFSKESFACFDPNPAPGIVGSNMFLNSTRSQIREMTDYN